MHQLGGARRARGHDVGVAQQATHVPWPDTHPACRPGVVRGPDRSAPRLEDGRDAIHHVAPVGAQRAPSWPQPPTRAPHAGSRAAAGAPWPGRSLCSRLGGVTKGKHARRTARAAGSTRSQAPAVTPSPRAAAGTRAAAADGSRRAWRPSTRPRLRSAMYSASGYAFTGVVLLRLGQPPQAAGAQERAHQAGLPRGQRRVGADARDDRRRLEPGGRGHDCSRSGTPAPPSGGPWGARGTPRPVWSVVLRSTFTPPIIVATCPM